MTPAPLAYSHLSWKIQWKGHRVTRWRARDIPHMHAQSSGLRQAPPVRLHSEHMNTSPPPLDPNARLCLSQSGDQPTGQPWAQRQAAHLHHSGMWSSNRATTLALLLSMPLNAHRCHAPRSPNIICGMHTNRGLTATSSVRRPQYQTLLPSPLKGWRHRKAAQDILAHYASCCHSSRVGL